MAATEGFRRGESVALTMIFWLSATVVGKIDIQGATQQRCLECVRQPKPNPKMERRLTLVLRLVETKIDSWLDVSRRSECRIGVCTAVLRRRTIVWGQKEDVWSMVS